MRLPAKQVQELIQEHAEFCGVAQKMPRTTENMFTTKVEGCFCVYKPCKTYIEPTVIEEPRGVLRRECKDRVYCDVESWSSTDGAGSKARLSKVECAVKPGHLFLLPSSHFDDSWYSVADDDYAGGIHLNQKLFPPGVPFLSDLPSLKSEHHWRVVELMDNPMTKSVCRVLIRPARRIVVPDDPTPLLPVETKTLTSWYLPFAHGEVVSSLSSVPLAYEVRSSLSRHPGEPHCLTVEPIEALTLAHQGGRAPVSSGTLSDPCRAWAGPTELCVVQHSALGPPQRSSSDSSWCDPPPKYLGTMDRFSSAGIISGAKPQLPVPRRQLPSPGAGYVCRVSEGAGGRATVVVLGPGDCVEVACLSCPCVTVGALVKQDDMLSSTDKAPVSGQVVLVQQRFPEQGSDAPDRGGPDSSYIVTLRRGRAYLVTRATNAIVGTGVVVRQGDLLGTEDLVVPKTADIVQGLPLINSMFEAAGGGLQSRLQKLWEEMKEHLGELEAAKRARDRIQMEVVSEIQGVYLDQGVTINSRHIEMVVRRMTEKCEVIDGLGSVLRPGAKVDYLDIDAIQALNPSGEIRVRPLIRGITVVGMQDNHVMVAMGFREIDNVLTSEILGGPLDHPMRGVKENLMMGKAINVGSNWSEESRRLAKTNSSGLRGMDFDKFPAGSPKSISVSRSHASLEQIPARASYSSYPDGDTRPPRGAEAGRSAMVGFAT